jgi:hypothetical protein
MPDDVCIPAGFRDVPVNYFDDYSWRAFVAMVWLAAAGHLGTAVETKPAGAAAPWPVLEPDVRVGRSMALSRESNPQFLTLRGSNQTASPSDLGRVSRIGRIRIR